MAIRVDSTKRIGELERRRTGGLGGLVVAALVAALTAGGCAAGSTSSATTSGARRPLYRPGQSLEAHLCECRECFDVSCCRAAEDEESESSSELGMSLKMCGRCVRRTWTVRGRDACEAHAPEECCPGSIEP